MKLPALTAELQQAVHRCVVALRDAHGIASPSELVYVAWREAEVVPNGFEGTDEEVAAFDRGDPALELPTLGLRRENA